jgi:hypothetical protein
LGSVPLSSLKILEQASPAGCDEVLIHTFRREVEQGLLIFAFVAAPRGALFHTVSRMRAVRISAFEMSIFLFPETLPDMADLLLPY